MNDIMSLFNGIWSMVDFTVLGMPLVAWLAIPAFFGLIAHFVRGKKG